MSFIDTDGRFPRFLTRAQKWAITNESAPSSSKKWLSTDTRSTRRTSASTSAKRLSAPVVAALPRSSINVDSAIAEHDDHHPLVSHRCTRAVMDLDRHGTHWTRIWETWGASGWSDT